MYRPHKTHRHSSIQKRKLLPSSPSGLSGGEVMSMGRTGPEEEAKKASEKWGLQVFGPPSQDSGGGWKYAKGHDSFVNSIGLNGSFKFHHVKV